MTCTSRIATALLACTWLSATAFQAFAQAAPQPIRLIVPIAAGSVTDIAARLMAKHLSDRLGQPVVVINRAGGNTIPAAVECAKSPPDGNTLCIVNPDTLSYNPFTTPNLSYDPAKDFRPVTNMYFVIEGLLARGTLPANTMEEFRALASSKPDALTFGTLGPRSITDSFRQWLGQFWNTSFVAVPYKGGSEIVNALLTGSIDVARIGVGNIAGQLNDGKVKVLTLRSTKRNELLPNVPTMDEAGFASFPGGRPWWGIVVPSGTPDAMVQKLNTEIVSIFRLPEVVDFMKKQFLDIDVGSPEAFAAFLKKDRDSAEYMVKTYKMAQ
ncbi:MAG: tripartite tricarboxylate transporter substrate binding protein [Pseudorhodoplanes sp.]